MHHTREWFLFDNFYLIISSTHSLKRALFGETLQSLYLSDGTLLPTLLSEQYTLDLGCRQDCYGFAQVLILKWVLSIRYKWMSVNNIKLRASVTLVLVTSRRLAEVLRRGYPSSNAFIITHVPNLQHKKETCCYIAFVKNKTWGRERQLLWKINHL